MTTKELRDLVERAERLAKPDWWGDMVIGFFVGLNVALIVLLIKGG